jgi:hypothetical protein
MASSRGWWQAGPDEVIEAARRLAEDLRRHEEKWPTGRSALRMLDRAIADRDAPTLRYVLDDCFEVVYLPRCAKRLEVTT